VDAPLPLEGHRPIRADVVFRQARVAVFIDGCFWHGCPEHYSKPRSNTEYWTPKIERNQRRDELANRLLTISGWKVIRAWEHEDPSDVAFEIASVVWSRVAAGTG
jgi:DNA mismatch endonuclease (patch repair protein)